MRLGSCRLPGAGRSRALPRPLALLTASSSEPHSAPHPRRVAAGELTAVAGQRILDAAVLAAAHQRPTLGASLHAKVSAASPASQIKPQQAPRPAPARPAANNAVPGPARHAARGADGLLRGITACLPAALLLLVPTLPESPPLLAVMALVLVSFVAESDV